MSTPPKHLSVVSLAPPPLPIVLPQQLPITPVRHDKDKENCFSPAALLLPCFRLVTADGLQVTLEPMDRRQAQLQYIDYKLHTLQGKQREGRKRRNTGADEKQFNPHDAPVNQFAAIARDRDNRPQQPRLSSPPKLPNPHSMAAAVSLSVPSTLHSSSGGGVLGRSASAVSRTPPRKPLLPRFPPNPSMVAKANGGTHHGARQRRGQ